MLFKIAIGFAVLVAIFVVFVSTREGKFRYERSGVINAPKEMIYPYISNFRLGEQWSPYEKIDPNMKKTFAGDDAQVGATMVFEGNANAGSGKLEILSMTPNESVQIRLIMTKPFPADNVIDYKLITEGEGTRFTWVMAGDGGFFGKLVNVFIDCEAMVGGQFNDGIANLKALVEGQKK